MEKKKRDKRNRKTYRNGKRVGLFSLLVGPSPLPFPRADPLSRQPTTTAPQDLVLTDTAGPTCQLKSVRGSLADAWGTSSGSHPLMYARTHDHSLARGPPCQVLLRPTEGYNGPPYRPLRSWGLGADRFSRGTDSALQNLGLCCHTHLLTIKALPSSTSQPCRQERV